MDSARQIITDLLHEAGVTVGGSEPCDLQVHDERLFERFLVQGSLGLGESYMDGWWDVERLDEFFEKIFRALNDRNIGSDCVIDGFTSFLKIFCREI